MGGFGSAKVIRTVPAGTKVSVILSFLLNLRMSSTFAAATMSFRISVSVKLISIFLIMACVVILCLGM